MTYFLLFLFPILLAIAGISDLITMRIPNWLALSVAALFLMLAFLAGMPVAQIGLHAVAALAVLAIGFALFALGWIGGGDAKLMAATALWFGYPLLLNYLLWAAVFGGILTLIIIIWRRTPMPEAIKAVPSLGRLYDRKTGIPYGVGLAIAGVMLFPLSPMVVLISG